MTIWSVVRDMRKCRVAIGNDAQWVYALEIFEQTEIEPTQVECV
jgi:hypothetical protein